MQVFATLTGRQYRAFIDGVPVEPQAHEQFRNISSMPFVPTPPAMMADAHLGKGATVGTVFPSKGAIIPAAVGVDIGCGMIAQKTSLKAEDLPDHLYGVRSAWEKAIPHGRTDNGGAGDRGAWGNVNHFNQSIWKDKIDPLRMERLVAKHPKIARSLQKAPHHVGTLGGGNHFVELCLDESNDVWIMLHSGSRGIGNKIGDYFINLAKEDMRRYFINLPDADLAYLPEGTDHFNDYIDAMLWAQNFARWNRRSMMHAAVNGLKMALRTTFECSTVDEHCVESAHNYCVCETHFKNKVWLTRKGATSAKFGEYGIIPGSMGAKSFITRGLGNKLAYESAPHGAGRAMSRTEAKRRFTVEDHIRDTAGIECRKDEEVIDETPKSYKDIDAVMAASSTQVEIAHTLRQVVCVKG